MTVSELIGSLRAYPDDMPVRVFDDWGTGFNLVEISGVTDSSEWNDREEPAEVVISVNDECGAKDPA